MKKIIFLLSFFAVAIVEKGFAQTFGPTYCFSPQQIQVNEGDNVCFNLMVDDFTDIISTQFTIRFDPAVLEYVSISNFHPNVPGLDIADFGVATAGLGYITFIWNDGQPCQNATTGASIDEATDPNPFLFTICFKAIGDYGNHSPIEIVDSPIDRVTRRATAACFDIGEYICNGFVSIGTSPLKINIGSANGNPGETVCVDFKVEDFNDLVSMQYYIFYDPAVLEYQSSMKMNLGSSGDQYDIFHSAPNHMIATSWYTNDINNGKTLADGTQILQVCFKIIGNCGQIGSIYISDNPNSSPPEPIEVIDEITGADPSNGTNIGLLSTPGEVTVNCVDPDGITINMADKNVCPGETFTLDVKLEDFNQIASMMFDLKWNPAVIQYQSVEYPIQPGSNCLPWSNGFSAANANQGLIHMDWSTIGQGCNKPDGYILFRLTFKVVGASGSSTNVAVVDPIFVDKFGGQAVDIGINSNNSFVKVCELSNPTISAESENANPGETVCIDFTVQDFNDITSMGYTLAWEPTVLQFTGLQGFNLAGLSQANFNTSQAGNLGLLGVDWTSAVGETVPDGVSIFTACFKVLGDPDECTVIEFTDSPWPINIETTVSNATNVGLNGQPGQVCALNPFIFSASLPDQYSGQNSTICVDLTVENFNQLTNTEYSINWDPDVIEFQNATPSGALANFTSANYNLSNAPDGNMTIDWAAANQILGTSLPDGTAILKLCFKVIGSSGECSPLTISGYPMPTVINSATTGPANLTLGANNGSICVSGAISMASYTVTDVSCGGAPNGAIDITIAGGSGQFAYQWSGPCDNPISQDQTNLCVGNYVVTVTDILNPSLKIIQPFNVVYSADAKFAHAGQDTIFSCGGFFMTLNGTASSTGPNTTYLWQAIGSGLVLPGQETSLTPQVIGGSLYKLTVTGPGCVDTDSVRISPAQIPVPYIDSLPPALTCQMDTVQLDGTLSPIGYDVMWTGPAIVPGTETFLEPKVTEEGMYYMTMTSPVTGCTGVDSVMVTQNKVYPTADAGSDGNLGCNVTSYALGGPLTSIGPNLSYDWVPIGPGQICGNPQSANISACSDGLFQLTVINDLNGCSAMDTVQVTKDQNAPTANAGTTQSLNCTNNSVTLDGSGSTPGMQYTWTNLTTGATIGQGSLTVDVTTAGTYQLEVLNTANNCSAIAQVIVENEQDHPDAVAASSNDIDCMVLDATLTAEGSATGNNISYAWLNSTGTQVGTGLETTVTTPGTYTLVVTDASNTCTSTATATVGNLTSAPVAEAGPVKFLTCDIDEVTLMGTPPGNASLLVQWFGPGQQCITGASTPNPVVSCPGFYTMQVYNSLTGCVGKDSVEVKLDTVKPNVNAGTDTALPCAGSSVQLQGTTDATDFIASWTTIPVGLPLTGGGTLTPMVSEPGTYVLSVKSNTNGCTNTDEVQVSLSPNGPQADAGEDTAIDCNNTTATLDASGSSQGVTYAWQQIVGGSFTSDQATVEVGAGLYMLTVSAGGCVDVDTVNVDNNIVDIQVVADSSGNLSCINQTVDLHGSLLAGPQGATLIWKDANGTIVGNGPTLTVTNAGTFTFEATDSNSGCTDSDEVTVSVVNDNLEQAAASVEYTECASDAALTGNLPTDATGQWTSPTGASFNDSSSPNATATDLVSGENLFIWTLSLSGCQNYDADTVTVTINATTAAPNAVNDNAVLEPGTGGEVTLNVLENDVFDFATGSFTLLPFDGFGEAVATDSGAVTFIKENCQAGKVQVLYELCNLTCPDLCSEGILTVDIKQDPAEPCSPTDAPNGITPNGDGVNDEFVFDILLSGENFPDNEIIIFNRWGDQVYHAKPYNNDWKGTNQNGKDLPAATYYYVLRLNIADGVILRGDVTILK
ncbi:MAG: gliding motility-associated C-terminal domain-containing protein [Saprospiraceae bacterium]|nr:gliding motility-associated C-terminal domain-containing protein [Saprospiraceae bacterium]